MKIDEYQEQALKTAIYPNQGEFGGLCYAVLGLTNESGEVAGKLKKVLRDADGILDDDRKNQMFMELGDVLWYVAVVAKELGCSLESVAQYNLDKLHSRQERGQIKGDGDTR